MKTAQQSAAKFVSRASNASQDYADGAAQTTKDQSAAAIAAKQVYAQGVQAAITRGAFEKGLAKSGKAGWLKGVQGKGKDRYAGGVAESADKYAANSAPFDTARQAAANLPRGLKGSETNFNRSKAVGQALNKVRLGQSA